MHFFARVDEVEKNGRDRWAVTSCAAAIALTVLLVFRSAAGGALLAWDDDINIVMNTHLRGLTWENLRWMFTDFDYIRRYAPLTWLDWTVNYEMFGLTARSCHVGNILFHAANAVLVFLIVRRVLVGRATQATKAALSKSVPLIAAFTGTLVWAVHPLRVEVVAWASGRIYCQAGFFFLAATFAYLRAAQTAAPRAARGWRMLSVAALAASLLTYPLALGYVGLLLVIDVWLLRRFRSGEGRWRDPHNRAVLREKIPFVLVTAAIVGVTLWARLRASGLWEPPPTLAEFGFTARVAQALYIWSYYLWRPFAPIDLAPVYTTLVRFNPTDLPFVAGALCVGVVTAWLVWKRREWPAALALWLAHLVLLAPMLGLTEHPHYPNDRYSYLQGGLWAVVAAAAMAWLMQRASRLAVAGAAGVIAGLCLLSTAQIRLWHDDETLFRYLYEKLEGNSYRADIATRLAETLHGRRRFHEAALLYSEALQLEPSSRLAGIAHFRLGAMAEQAGQREVARRHYEQALRFDPERSEAREALARLR